MPFRRAWIAVAGAVGIAELLHQSIPGWWAPELAVYPVVLALAYRRGLRAAAWSAAVATAYVVLLLVRTDPATDAIGAPAERLAGLALAAAAALAMGTLRDRVASLEARERAVRDEAAAAVHRSREVLDVLGDGFALLDGAWRFVYVNRAAEALFRRSGEELLGREARAVFPPSLYLDFYRQYQRGAASQTAVRFEAAAPDERWIEVLAVPAPEGIAMSFRDVTDRRRHEDKLRSMTLVDELTGLYNRRGFFALAEQQIKLARRKQREMLLVFADLDGLKEINDSFGHTAGDQALFEVAAVLRQTFRETDVVARIGGDEFAALALDSGPDSAPLLLDRLDANLAQANAEATLPFALSLSCGFATLDAAASQPLDELLSLADHRMYEQKRKKRKQF